MDISTDNKLERSAFELVYLDPKTVRFGYEGETLTFIDTDGTYYPRVTLRRCFPLSAQNTNILVSSPGIEMERGPEIGILKDLVEMNPESQEAVERELSLHYFVPVIRKINSIRDEFGFLYWSVDTDRGSKNFIMRDSIIGSTRRVSEGRWLIIDINQTRYEIRDFESLDTRSQDFLQRYLLL
jgi:hypothetical protein